MLKRRRLIKKLCKSVHKKAGRREAVAETQDADSLLVPQLCPSFFDLVIGQVQQDSSIVHYSPKHDNNQRELHLILVQQNKHFRMSTKGGIIACFGNAFLNGLDIHTLLSKNLYSLLQVDGSRNIIDRVSQAEPSDNIMLKLKNWLGQTHPHSSQLLLETLDSVDASILNRSGFCWMIVSSAPGSTIEIEEIVQPFLPRQIRDVFDSCYEVKREVLLVGPKNTGKSTVCEYFVNRAVSESRPLCFLDLDIGKSSYLPGTISLYYYSPQAGVLEPVRYTYWIGEYSPLNFTSLYLLSVDKLYQIYCEKYFTVPLIVNTMGYLTGLGEILLYQIFNIMQPQLSVFLSKQQVDEACRKVMASLQNKSFLDRLHFMNKQVNVLPNRSFMYVANPQAVNKHAVDAKSKHFEKMLGFCSFRQLLLNKSKISVQVPKLLLQSKAGTFDPLPLRPIHTDLQLLILCRPQSLGVTFNDLRDRQLYLFEGLCFGFDGQIFVSDKLKHLAKETVCIKSEMVEFEKQFYNLSEKELISIQLELDRELQYILPNYKALGSVSYRNLSAKSHYRKTQ